MKRCALALFACPALAAITACGAGDAAVADPASAPPAEVRAEAPGDPVAASEPQPAPPEGLVEPEPRPAASEPQAAAPGEAGSGPERPILGSEKGAQGPTEFPHWTHQREGIKCVSCHHAGSRGRSCGRGADCHQAAEVNAPSAKDAFHTACRPCHKKKGFPTGCDFCHAPKAP